jgi:hypothetical protein
VTGIEDQDAFLRRVEWRIGIETRGGLEHLGRSGVYFRFNPDMHTHLALGTGQEKKSGPDQDKQDDIDNALEVPRRGG